MRGFSNFVGCIFAYKKKMSPSSAGRRTRGYGRLLRQMKGSRQQPFQPTRYKFEYFSSTIKYCDMMGFTIDWATFYLQLQASYMQLAQAIEAQQVKQQELKNFFTKHANSLPKIKEASERESSFVEESEFQPLKAPQRASRKKTKEKVLSRLRSPLETQTAFICPYEECDRSYNTPISLNLHIKLKHNGGTKKEREIYARMMIEAEEAGKQPPKISIVFPPHFMEEYKCNFRYRQKYCS